MNINHRPVLDIKIVEDFYSEKDGVPVKYVCTSALDDTIIYGDIFYRATPHPEFGNKYFMLFKAGGLYIRAADKVEELVFTMLDTPTGYHYSQHRHDFYSVEGVAIDGGRAYVRLVGNNVKTKRFKVKDGEFVECEQ